MKLTDLTFSYGDKRVFQALTLALPDEGITALTGPSGCGKTTLLRLIARLETPQGGSIDAPPPAQIALLFQEDRLIPHLSARRQIALVRPKTIVALGATAFKGLSGDPMANISRHRGTWCEFEGIPMMPTFHPAYLLRVPSAKRVVWEDLQKVMARLKQ